MRFGLGICALVVGLAWASPALVALAQPTKICVTEEGGYQNSTFCERSVRGVHATWQYLRVGVRATDLRRGEITRFPTVPERFVNYTTPFFDPPITDPRTWSD